MSTLKANKDKARFISNPINQDVADGDWVDHEVITKYKLPEITLEASTTTTSVESLTEITTGDNLKVLDGANMVERTAGTVTIGGGLSPLNDTFDSGLDGYTANGATLSNVSGRIRVDGAAGVAYKALTTEIGTSYTITADQFLGTATSVAIYASTTINQADYFAYTDSSQDTLATTMTFTAVGTTTYLLLRQNTGIDRYVEFDNISCPASIDGTGGLFQAPITATTNIPTKAYFNKTIDTTLSAEATGKCKSSTVTQIGVL